MVAYGTDGVIWQAGDASTTPPFVRIRSRFRHELLPLGAGAIWWAKTVKHIVWSLKLALTWAVAASAWSADLSVQDVAMLPGETGALVVSGSIANETVAGVTIVLEILPRPGNTGTVMFTPSPPVDIEQLGDPWPGVGKFSRFDTDRSFSVLRNGTVDDNGTLIPSPVTFSGALVAYPIVASQDADGVWDVSLSIPELTSSSWEGVLTTLINGRIIIPPPECMANEECDDANPCTHDVCIKNSCRHIRIADCDRPVSLDIKPGSCPNPVNRRSQGVVPVAVVGSDTFSVSEVDADTVIIARVDGVGGVVKPIVRGRGKVAVIDDVATPLRGETCECHEMNSDGIDDLFMRFWTPELADVLELDATERDDLVELAVRGRLKDGRPFEASDCIRIVGRQSDTRPQAGRGHNTLDPLPGSGGEEDRLGKPSHRPEHLREPGGEATSKPEHP